jgi:kinesin family protein 18/19
MLTTVRVRPFNAKELPLVSSIRDSPLWVGEGSLTATPQNRLTSKGVIRPVVQVLDERVLVFDPPEENPVAQYSKTIVASGRKTKDMRYAFDRVFDERCTQEDVSSLPERLIPGVYTYCQTAAGWCPGWIQCNCVCLWCYGMWKDTYYQVSLKAQS